MRISDLLGQIETFAPLSLALDWDNVGLLLGSPESEINRILVSLDVTPNAVERAIRHQAQLILSHHPVIFRPLSRFTDPLLLRLAENRIAVVSLHTNLDVAPGGVNHALAAALGLEVTGLLSAEYGGKWQHLSLTVPLDHTEKVMEAAFAAGGGRVGNYVHCSARHPVTGTFRPLPGARPWVENPGVSGRTAQNEEELELMVDEAVLPAVLAAIRASHPYETPLLYHFPVANPNPAYGLGLVGKFEKSFSLKEIRDLVSERLSCPRPRLWTAGRDLAARIERVAVCGGAGASVLKAASAATELLISGDIGYHHMLESRIPVIDAGHFYTEYPVLDALAGWLRGLGLECDILPRDEHEYARNLVEV